MSPLSRPKSTRPRSPDRGSIGVQPGGLRFTEGPQYRSSMGITDGIVQFEGEREMWASFQDSDLRAKRRLRALVVGLALVVSLRLLPCLQCV